jgi:hypothetical protein
VTGSVTPYSQLRSDQRINLAEAVPLAAPFTLHIEPTKICNFRYSYCPESLPEFERLTGFQEMRLSQRHRKIEACRDCIFIDTAPVHQDKPDLLTLQASRERQ